MTFRGGPIHLGNWAWGFDNPSPPVLLAPAVPHRGDDHGGGGVEHLVGGVGDGDGVAGGAGGHLGSHEGVG